MIYDLLLVSSIQYSSSTVTHSKSSPPLEQLLPVNIGCYRITGHILQAVLLSPWRTYIFENFCALLFSSPSPHPSQPLPYCNHKSFLSVYASTAILLVLFCFWKYDLYQIILKWPTEQRRKGNINQHHVQKWE